MSHPLPSASPPPATGRYLTFGLGTARYGLPLEVVQETIATPPVTRLPGMGHGIKGVFNLRGRVVPVIDLRERLGLIPGASDGNAFIVVLRSPLNHDALPLGILADEMPRVLAVEEQDVDPAPPLGVPGETALFEGITRSEGEVVVLLNRDELLAPHHLDTDPGAPKR